MSRFVKWLMAALGAVLVIFTIAALVLPQVIDPNDYKQEIRDQVHAQTGRGLNIGGDIDWRVFPWIGLDLHDISLDNRSGFGEQPMLSAGKIAVSVKLAPLFHRAIEIGSIELDDLSVYLHTKADGRNNWEDLSGEPTGSTQGTKDSGPGLRSFRVAGIRVSNASVTWDDAGQITELSDFHVNISDMQPGQPFDLKGGFAVHLAQSKLDGTAGFAGRVEAATNAARFGIEGLEFTFRGRQGDDGRALNLDLGISTDAEVDLASDQARLTDFVLRFHDLVLSGQLTARALSGAPRVDGDLEIAGFSPRALLNSMGIKPGPGTREDVLGSMSAKMYFTGSQNGAAMKKLRVKFDRTEVTGDVTIENFNAPRLAFDLEADRINLDDYLSSSEEEEQPNDLTADTFRGFTGGGTLKIGHVVVAGLTATDVDLKMSSDGQGIRFYPVTAKVYGGTHAGDIRIDARGPHPLLTGRQKLTNIQAEGLLQDLAGTARLEGTGDLSVDIVADLSNARSTRESLSGDLALNLHDGAIVGIDVTETLRKASALLGRKDQSANAAGEASKTEFSDLSMTATASRGIVRNDDLTLRSPVLRMTGRGEVNLVSETIDYVVKPVLKEDVAGLSAPQLEKIQGVPIPIKLSGNLYDPSIRVDIAAALTASQKAKIDAKKDELKDKVLGKLLGGKDEAEDDSSDQPESKDADDDDDSDASARDLLKGLFGGKKKDEGNDESGGIR